MYNKINQKKMKKAIILLSGGLDSATCLSIAMNLGYECFGLSFDYGQRHKFELDCAKKLAKHYKIADHKIMKIDLRSFGGSALTADIEVPKHRNIDLQKDQIPITYVPARNTIFLSFALGYAEVINCNDIFIGVNALDYSGYPDCRPEFIESFEKMANLGTKSGVNSGKIKIHTPLIDLKKFEIIQKANLLDLNFKMTHSCYDPDETNGRSCGHCDSCILRLAGFKKAKIDDPISYGE